jgi:hypothetical protein
MIASGSERREIEGQVGGVGKGGGGINEESAMDQGSFACATVI